MGFVWQSKPCRLALCFFRRHFFQHAGFRYIATNNTVNAVSSRYETDNLYRECRVSLWRQLFWCQTFSAALAKLALTNMVQHPARSALDLGCASGRATFN